MILRTDLRDAHTEGMYYLAAMPTVIFPRFDAIARMKTDLMSKLKFL